MEFSLPTDLAWLSEDSGSELADIKLQQVSAGAALIDLSMINPDLPPPRLMLDRLMEASGKTFQQRYSVARGIRRLRTAFSAKYAQRFGVELDPEREVCITMGSKNAVLVALRVLGLKSGAVLLSKPTYPAHLSAVRLNGLNPCWFASGGHESETIANFKEAVEEHHPKAALFCSPNNPTGECLSESAWFEIRKTAHDHDVLLVNDFVYGELSFGERAAISLLKGCSGNGGVLESYSLSKGYGVPGWRVGALVGDRKVIQVVSRLKAHLDYGVFLPLQHAAAFALEAEEDLVAAARAIYESRLGLVADQLSSLGWTCKIPNAGVCIWAKLPEQSRWSSAFEFARALLKEHSVHLLPGELFGTEFSEYVRIAVVQTEERLLEALNRIKTLG